MYSVDVGKLTEEHDRILSQMQACNAGSETWFELKEDLKDIQKLILDAQEDRRKNEAAVNEEAKAELEHRDRVYKANRDFWGKIVEGGVKVVTTAALIGGSVYGMFAKWKMENDDTHPGIIKIDEFVRWMFPKV